MIVLDGNSLTLRQLLAIAVDRAGVSIARGRGPCAGGARRCRRGRSRRRAGLRLNTGFRSFAEVKIEATR